MSPLITFQKLIHVLYEMIANPVYKADAIKFIDDLKAAAGFTPPAG